MMEAEANRLIALSVEMNRQGVPLMHRILPPAPEQWAHYPPDDAVGQSSGARYFYHCHPTDDRDGDEHGHFHMFLPLALFPRALALSTPADDGAKRAAVVHFAALSVNSVGVPFRLFTVNRWVTDEWLFPAAAIVDRLDAFDLAGADGDDLVNAWLTSFVRLAKADIAALLAERDQTLERLGWPGEDRSVEVTSASMVDLQSLLETALHR